MKIAQSRLVAASVTVGLTFASVMGLSSAAFAASTVSSTVISTTGDQLDDNYYSATSPDGKWIAISGYQSDYVTLVDTTTNTQVLVTDPTTDINSPLGVAFSPDNSTVYVANYGDSTVVVIDVATATVIDTITTDSSENIAATVSADGSILLVSDDYDNVTTFDLATGNKISSYASTTYIINIFENADGTYYLVDYYGDISVLDLTPGTDAITSTIAPDVDRASYGACITSDHSVLYFVDTSTTPTQVVGVNPVTNTVLSTTELPLSATGSNLCAITPADNRILVSDEDIDIPGVVYEVTPATQTVTNTYVMTGLAYTTSLAVSGCNVYVAGYYDNIQILELDDVSCNGEPTLPNTGIDATAIASVTALAVVALLSGFVMLVARRRKA